MLVDSIKRYNAADYFKFINIENYKAKGIEIPKKVHSVPALMFLDNTKTVMFGKQVFDFLLLPTKGYLFNLPKKEKESSNHKSDEEDGELVPFQFSGSASGDAFSFIEEEQTPDKHKAYNWSGIQDAPSISISNDTLNVQTRSKKGLPDLGTLQSDRDLELQKYLNST